MAPTDLDTIYKSIRFLPEFDGNPHVLTRFINHCDQLVIAHFDANPGHELQNLALISGILNKVTGPAARLINGNGIPENWIGIRNALINNFADHRDETALYNDLSLQTQGSSTPQEFYEKCQNLFSTIMTYISLHESVSTTVEAKRQLYQKLTLQCYLRGLKDPLGSRIRCMRPVSMEKALEFVQEELNTLYIQQRNEGAFFNKNFEHTFSVSNNIGPPRPQDYSMPWSSWQQPMYFRPPPQPMQFRPPGWNPNKINTLRPMSGISHFTPKHFPPTEHDWRKLGNPPTTNYKKTRDVNFNEYDYNNSEQYSDEYYNNFRESPSNVDSSPIVEEVAQTPVASAQDALSRIEINMQELSSITVNRLDGVQSIDDSENLSSLEVDDSSRTATVHTDDRNSIGEQLRVTPPANKTFELVHLDLLSVESIKFLTIVDSFSKYAQAYFIGDRPVVSVVQALLKFCTHHGKPLTVVTGNDPEFTNKLMSEFFKLHKIQHLMVAPHTPNVNGIVEKFQLSILEHLPNRIYARKRRGPFVKSRLKSVTNSAKCRRLTG